MTVPTVLTAILAQLSALTEAEQLTVICELVQGGPSAGHRSDAFIDALWSVDKALSGCWPSLEAAADSARCAA
jgi:hypothetical protein